MISSIKKSVSVFKFKMTLRHEVLHKANIWNPTIHILFYISLCRTCQFRANILINTNAMLMKEPEWLVWRHNININGSSHCSGKYKLRNRYFLIYLFFRGWILIKNTIYNHSRCFFLNWYIALNKYSFLTL